MKVWNSNFLAIFFLIYLKSKCVLNCQGALKERIKERMQSTTERQKRKRKTSKSREEIKTLEQHVSRGRKENILDGISGSVTAKKKVTFHLYPSGYPLVP